MNCLKFPYSRSLAITINSVYDPPRSDLQGGTKRRLLNCGLGRRRHEGTLPCIHPTHLLNIYEYLTLKKGKRVIISTFCLLSEMVQTFSGLRRTNRTYCECTVLPCVKKALKFHPNRAEKRKVENEEKRRIKLNRLTDLTWIDRQEVEEWEDVLGRKFALLKIRKEKREKNCRLSFLSTKASSRL